MSLKHQCIGESYRMKAKRKSKKNDLPLNCVRNCNHKWRSPFTALFKRIICIGRLMPTVRLIIRRRNVLPGTTTEQVKFNNPMRDCMSFRVTFLRFRKSCIVLVHLSILSWGSTKRLANIYLLYSVHILLFLLFSNMKSELSVKLSGEGGGKDRHFKVGSLQA